MPMENSTAAGEAFRGLSASVAVPLLIERFGDKVFSFGLKFCGNRDDAADLAQETFLQAFRK